MGKLTDGYSVDGAWQCVFGACLMGLGSRAHLPATATAVLLVAGAVLAAVGVRKTWGVSPACKAGDIAVAAIAVMCFGKAFGAA